LGGSSMQIDIKIAQIEKSLLDYGVKKEQQEDGK
jgi:hypothetical protein